MAADRYKFEIENNIEHKHVSYLYNSMYKHGYDNFCIEVVEQVDDSDLNSKEKYYIEAFNSRDADIGYNIAPGGYGGALFEGHSHSEETRQKMSADRTGEKNSNFGNHWHHTKDMAYRYDGENNPMYGKKHTEESKIKSMRSHIGKKAVSNLSTGEVKIIHPEEIDAYLNNGWVLGNKFHYKSKK